MDFTVLLTFLALLVGGVLFDWWYLVLLRSRSLPPSPAPWPLFGNVLQMKKWGSGFANISQNLEQKFGKVFTLWIGKRPLIFVHDAALANDALVKQGKFFANRPQIWSQQHLSSGFMTLNTSEGWLTAALRKNIMSHMLSPAKLKECSHIRSASSEDIIKGLQSATEGDGNATEVNVSEISRISILRHMLVLVFGIPLPDHEVHAVLDILKWRFRNNFEFLLGDYIHAWRVFQRAHVRARKENQAKARSLFKPIIEKLRSMQGKKGVISGTYCETLFQLQRVHPELDDGVITSLCCEFLNASTQTSATAVGNTMALLSEHPLAQETLRREIEATVGDRDVVESDLPALRYLSAVVRESLRLKPPALMSIPHATSEGRDLGGFQIPTNAIVLFNLAALHLDPNRWSDPLSFVPERFLEEDLDVLGHRDFSFLPFSAGRRGCPGSYLAMLTVSLAVARMVQEFEWQGVAAQPFADVLLRACRR